jgi:hypothetical protein
MDSIAQNTLLLAFHLQKVIRLDKLSHQDQASLGQLSIDEKLVFLRLKCKPSAMSNL